MRQLLTHSSGIANPIPLGWIHLQEEHEGFDRQAFFHEVFTKHHKLKSQPNARFAYSNLGYALLGQIIENVSGMRYVQALLAPQSGLVSDESRRLLFTENVLSSGKPSGMSMSWFKGELDGPTPNYAHAGGGGGYYAAVRIYPELQRGSVILFNRSGMLDERFLDWVDRCLIHDPAIAQPTRRLGVE